MPSDNAPAPTSAPAPAPGPAHQRPATGGHHRSTSSTHSQTHSPSTTPPQQTKQKGHKHVVSTGRIHTRASSSSKGLPKLTTKAHGNEGSHTDMRKLTKNSSATTLKKNSSHANLRRNRSTADVPRKLKEVQVKRPASVHFEIGSNQDQDQDQEDGWEEASSSASPALSRSASRSAVSSNQSSAKPSADNSQHQSPVQSHPPTRTTDGSSEQHHARHSTEGKIITERLLQRTPSLNTTKMSLATATPTTAGYLPDDMKSQGPPSVNSTPNVGSKDEVVSRFVGGSGTPSENSPFLHHHKNLSQDAKHLAEEVKRTQSMGNLAARCNNRDDDSEESALAPRTRKSTQPHAYIPPQQSRTQQKLWLQRASSNIEPQQMAPGVGMGALSGLHGAGYDGRDPRLKLQLERTGLEYLVVRRHQDPVGIALKRLEKLPGMEKMRRIPKKDGAAAAGAGRYGVGGGHSQSPKESRMRGKGPASSTSNGGGGGGGGGGRSSYDAAAAQASSPGDASERGGGGEDDGVTAILRSIWEKNFDSSSTGAD